MKYIVFMIDSKHKDHDGKIFSSVDDAKDFLNDMYEIDFFNKAIIGMFVYDKDKKEMIITMVESFGFPGDKKITNQLSIF